MNNGERESPFEYLKKLQEDGRKIVYIPNPGNYGDGLICAATLQQFGKNSIEYISYSKKFKHSKEYCYVYGGGGNFTALYPQAKQILLELAEHSADAVILPQSCYGVDEEITSYPGSLRIYAREQQTNDYLKTIQSPRLTFKIYDDIALHLDTTDPLFFNYQVFKKLLQDTKKDGGRLNAFRKDAEGRFTKTLALQPGNIDLSHAWPKDPYISKGFSLYWLEHSRLYNYISWFLSYVDMFDEVHTDRLHVGVAAFILKKKTFLYDNSYGKVKSVYEYSMLDREGYTVQLMDI